MRDATKPRGPIQRRVLMYVVIDKDSNVVEEFLDLAAAKDKAISIGGRIKYESKVIEVER